jgi:Autotransporter beta-domain
MSAFKQSVCGALLSVTAVLQPGPADAQDLQVTRHIGESITRRLTQVTLPEAEGRKPEDPITGWIAPSYTTIDFNDSDANIDIYQFVGGIDKRLGSFYAGASAGYARTESDFFGLESGRDNASFSPYAAYLINDNVFVTGIAGYAREEFDYPFNFDPSANTAFTDLSVTGVLPLGHWVVTGRAGHRFAYTPRMGSSLFLFDAESGVIEVEAVRSVPEGMQRGRARTPGHRVCDSPNRGGIIGTSLDESKCRARPLAPLAAGWS